jgi:hypothetical protein
VYAQKKKIALSATPSPPRPTWRPRARRSTTTWPGSSGRGGDRRGRSLAVGSGVDLEGEIERKMAKNEAPPKPHAKAF